MTLSMMKMQIYSNKTPVKYLSTVSTIYTCVDYLARTNKRKEKQNKMAEEQMVQIPKVKLGTHRLAVYVP